MSRRMSILLTLLLALSMMLVPAVAGAQDPTTDAQLPAAPRYSHRLIVQLSSPSLATWFSSSATIAGGAPTARLDVNAPAAQAYVQRLQAEQNAFAAALTRAIPNARIATFMDESGRAQAETYQVVMNGLVVDAGQSADLPSLERQLRALPGVKQVFRDYEQAPEMYASLPLIGAPTLWDQLGGQDMSGEGILFASIDTGVYAPNPFFDPTGYSYPPGFPKGDRRSTTPKVIAARAYFRPWDPPLPTDAGALPGPNSSSHGTHTSGTVAGNANTVVDLGGYTVTLSGVAPKAQILSYRIGYPTNSKYSGSAFTAEIVKAYEDAVRDGAQVINYSFGGYSGVMPWADGVAIARDAAWDAGVFVSHSAGNSGPGTGSVGDASPKVMEVAASSTTGTIGSGRLSITAPPPVPADLQDMAFASASFGASLEAGQVYSWPLKTAAAVDPANETGCSPWPAGAFTGKAAVISRGVCEFGVKVLNAEQAGAEFAVIYNSAAGGDTLINMAPGAVGNQVTIPSVFIWRSKGLAIVDWYAANGDASMLEIGRASCRERV